MEFTQTLEAFTDLTHVVQYNMFAVMVVVDKAETILINDGEGFDSWIIIIINGGVSVVEGFRIKPMMQVVYHQGVMTTFVNNCQFICFTKANYYKILNNSEDALVKEEKDGVLAKMIDVGRVDDDINLRRILYTV